MLFNSRHLFRMPLPKTIKTERMFHGRIFDLIIEDVEEKDGTLHTCEIISHPGGGVIIPFFENGDILLVRQYRYPHKQFVLEAPAGKLEPGEDPLACAKRELLEETGYTAEKFIKLTALYTTPGFCNEVLHIFLATGLKKSEHGQNLDDGEQSLTVETLPLSHAIEMVLRGEILDGKTIAGVLLAERKLKEQS
jgi:ADP-ribose pyrophosphatase